jgi:formiminotetrahydrofolate cyclodeaminase
MAGLADRPLGALLDVVGATDPAPGGGSSSAVSSALAAALVEMTAGLGGDDRTAARARELRARALELADEDLSSYAPVLEALRLPRDDPERAERLAAALSGASRTPLAIAETSAELATLGAAVTRASNAAVRGDALAGVLFAEASTVAAAALVEVNLGGQESADPQLGLARAARQRAHQAREEALSQLPRRR